MSPFMVINGFQIPLVSRTGDGGCGPIRPGNHAMVPSGVVSCSRCPPPLHGTEPTTGGQTVNKLLTLMYFF